MNDPPVTANREVPLVRRRSHLPITAASAIALALLAAIAVYGGRENRAARDARVRATLSHELLARSLEVENAVTLMEARHRAFLITGDAEFLRRRERSHRQARAAIEEMAGRIAAPSQIRLLGEIRQAVDQRHATMRETSERATHAGLDAARADFKAFGSDSIDPVRERLASLRGAQRTLAAQTQQQLDVRAARFERVLLYGTTLALLLLLLAGWALWRLVRRSEAIGAALDRTNAEQRAILESGGLIIVAARPDGVIRLFNHAASLALGYRPEELIGRHTPLLFHDETELAERARDLAAELGEPVAGFDVFAARARRGEVDRAEWTYIRKDGSRFPVELAISAVRDGVGRPHGYVGMALDLSQRQAAEREVRQLNASLAAKAEALAAANAELESFSYSVSHDLRAPLRHIDGYARMLHEDAGDGLAPELQHYLDRIAHSARRMGALIDDLLAFSRLARSAMQCQPVEMQSLAHDALRELRPQPGTVTIGELPEVAGDPALLRQVWSNLLSNAIKYSTPRGADARVSVQGALTDQVAVFEVSDNGVGFDMRYRDRLFGVFQRLHSQDEFEGTGVGLAIVQRIVRRHGGRIDASAEPGRGAVFRFELPLAGEA